MDRKISLGASDHEFSGSVHICQIYSSEQEREETLYQFIVTGMEAHEKIGCFSEKISDQKLDTQLKAFGFSLEQAKSGGALTCSSTREAYFHSNQFNPERMLKVLKEFYTESIERGFNSARVIGEMTPNVQTVSGGSRLLEYEAKVSMLLRTCPLITVCQYDSSQFDGSTIMDILKVHPLMIVGGAVIHNPFFVKPEEFLAQLSE